MPRFFASALGIFNRSGESTAPDATQSRSPDQAPQSNCRVNADRYRRSGRLSLPKPQLANVVARPQHQGPVRAALSPSTCSCISPSSRDRVEVHDVLLERLALRDDLASRFKTMEPSNQQAVLPPTVHHRPNLIGAQDRGQHVRRNSRLRSQNGDAECQHEISAALTRHLPDRP